MGEARAAARRTPSRDKDTSGDARAVCYVHVRIVFIIICTPNARRARRGHTNHKINQNFFLISQMYLSILIHNYVQILNINLNA